MIAKLNLQLTEKRKKVRENISRIRVMHLEIDSSRTYFISWLISVNVLMIPVTKIYNSFMLFSFYSVE